MLHLFSRLKKYLFLVMVILLTGCTAEYNLTINNASYVKESLDLIENDSTIFDVKNSSLYNSTLKEYLQTDLKWPTPISIDSETNPIEPTKIEGVSYYNKLDKSTNNQLKLNYNYKFNLDLFNKSRILRSCYTYEINEEDNVLNFKTISSLNCFEEYPLLQSAKINLKTSCKIIESNADEVNKDLLVWNITKDSYYNKNIAFSLDCNTKKTSNNYEQEIYILVVFSSYIFIILVIFFLIKILNKKNNKI